MRVRFLGRANHHGRTVFKQSLHPLYILTWLYLSNILFFLSPYNFFTINYQHSFNLLLYLWSDFHNLRLFRFFFLVIFLFVTLNISQNLLLNTLIAGDHRKVMWAGCGTHLAQVKTFWVRFRCRIYGVLELHVLQYEDAVSGERIHEEAVWFVRDEFSHIHGHARQHAQFFIFVHLLCIWSAFLRIRQRLHEVE